MSDSDTLGEWSRWSGSAAESLLAECPADLAFLALERYWNDGSPSGFRVDLPLEWSPASREASFELPWLRVQADRVTRLGSWQIDGAPSSWPDELWFPIHPGFAMDLRRSGPSDHVVMLSGRAVPLASARTVALIENGHIQTQLKLHYPGTVGRFSRDLHLFKVFASLDRSRRVAKALTASAMPVALFDERGGAVVEPDGDRRAFGYIVRDRPSAAGRFIPLFSLWATPPNGQRSVLDVLASGLGRSKTDLVRELAINLVEVYLGLALGHGLMPELNAQNVVLHLSSDGVAICLRDMQDVFVDCVQSPAQHDQTVSDYKLLTSESPDIHERRSFSFDFKLGDYILSPLLATLTPTAAAKLESTVRDFSNHLLRDHPGYLPAGRWYRYPIDASVGRLSYEEVSTQPRFR